jgi:hypothetical protein
MTTNQKREFDLSRKHRVGEYLNQDEAAKRVLQAHRREAREFYTLQARARAR